MKRHTPLFIVIMIILFLAGCSQGVGIKKESGKQFDDSIADHIADISAISTDSALATIDEYETRNIFSENVANILRAQTYYNEYQLRTANYYAHKALKDGKLQQESSSLFYFAYSLLIDLSINKGDVKEALDYASEAIKMARDDKNPSAKDEIPEFLGQIGQCQLSLGRKDEGLRSFEQAYTEQEKICKKKQDFSNGYTLFNITFHCIDNILSNSENETIEHWLTLMDNAFNAAIQSKDITPEWEDICRSYMEIAKARVYIKTGKDKEAEEHYTAFLKTQNSKSDFGQVGKSVYLETSSRWNELAELQEYIDSLEHKTGRVLTIDYLSTTLGTKFTAELKSGQKDKALITAERIVNALDSAEIMQQQSDAAELATIYETQEKEAKIAEQDASLARQQLIATAIALLLLVVFSAIFFFFRHRAAKRLEKAHDDLLTAYNQLEETTTVKERIESELRIARDIQMSMIPQTFPQSSDFDLYASMAPAREVGGDLYDYIAKDDHLYFCVGDVSGKGVPASLFMAQVIRLFRALTKIGLYPAQIATRLNEELTENNENGMFVTMFIGLVDMQSGHLHFCNAGHNPPILGGDARHGSFIEMEPNAPIGLWPDLEYVGEEIESIKGKPLFVYTDGLNEAENTRQEQFGDEHLLALLRETQFNSARQIIEHLQAAVELHRNGAEPNDDLTMMCLKLKEQT